jgi:hypothetical protein
MLITLEINDVQIEALKRLQYLEDGFSQTDMEHMQDVIDEILITVQDVIYHNFAK